MVPRQMVKTNSLDQNSGEVYLLKCEVPVEHGGAGLEGVHHEEEHEDVCMSGPGDSGRDGEEEAELREGGSVHLAVARQAAARSVRQLVVKVCRCGRPGDVAESVEHGSRHAHGLEPYLGLVCWRLVLYGVLAFDMWHRFSMFYISLPWNNIKMP